MKASFPGKKAFVFSVILLFSCLLLCGCGRSAEPEGETLWVVTEASNSDGMNLQAEIIAQRMEEKYDNLTIHLDILPSDAKEREILLKQLRTQIMAGNGPDIYLLPTGNVLTQDFALYPAGRDIMQIPIEPLFSDVVQIMRDGYFLDIQSYYENDQALDTGALKKEIMDAGILDGSRYVLPLRFNVPVVFTNPELWQSFCLSRELLDSNAIDLAKALLSQENGAAVSAGIQLPADLSLLSRPADHAKEAVLVTSREIAEYMRLYQQWRSVAPSSEEALVEAAREEEKQLPTRLEGLDFWGPIIDSEISSIANFNDVQKFSCYDMFWSSVGLPLYTASLSNVLETVGIVKTLGLMKGQEPELPMFPLRTSDGTWVASISYFGAVGCSCKNPTLAYEFLREFLTEEFQWESYRPRSNHSAVIRQTIKDPQNRGFVEYSWPVRTAGAVPHMWEIIQYQTKGRSNSFRDKADYVARLLQTVDVTDKDLPVLSWPIDEVRFPITLKEEESIEYALSLLNEEDGTPTDADIDALAQQVYQNLRYHLAEG